MKDFTYISVPRTASNSMHKALETNNINNHIPAKMLLLKGYSFGFIRNPFEQLKSWYDYHKHRGGMKDYFMPFNDWVQGGCVTHWKQSHLEYLKLSHPCQQSDYLTENGDILVDFIGLYENIQNDWKIICDTIGIDKQLELINTSKHPNEIKEEALQYYSIESIEVVKEIFKPTFKLYRHVLTKQ